MTFSSNSAVSVSSSPALTPSILQVQQQELLVAEVIYVVLVMLFVSEKKMN